MSLKLFNHRVEEIQFAEVRPLLLAGVTFSATRHRCRACNRHFFMTLFRVLFGIVWTARWWHRRHSGQAALWVWVGGGSLLRISDSESKNFRFWPMCHAPQFLVSSYIRDRRNYAWRQRAALVRSIQLGDVTTVLGNLGWCGCATHIFRHPDGWVGRRLVWANWPLQIFLWRCRSDSSTHGLCVWSTAVGFSFAESWSRSQYLRSHRSFLCCNGIFSWPCPRTSKAPWTKFRSEKK